MTDPSPDLPRDLPLDAPEHRQLLEEPASIPSQYLRAVGLARRPQGDLSADGVAALGPIVVERRGRIIEPELLARYRQVCGYTDGPGIPSAFMETLFQDLMVEIVLAPTFPFSPFGVIHLGQRMEWHGPVVADASLDLVCSLAAVCQTRRGFELDCAMHAHQHGEIAWEGLATLVSRSKATRRSGGRRTPPRVQEEVVGWCEPDLVEVAGDTGRRYAAVSGDYNPFHLHGLLARLFGFRRPIAHGMWTLARAMAWLEDQRALPERHRVQVDFKRPLLMPGRVALRQREVQAGDGERVAVEIEVRHATKQQPHLAGRVVW